MRFVIVVSLALMCAARTMAQSHQQSEIDVMPLPAHVQLGSGQLLIDGSFSIALEGARDARLERAADRFVVDLSRETGIPLNAAAAIHANTHSRNDRAVQKAIREASRKSGTPVRADIVPVGEATLVVYIEQASPAVPRFGEDESYTLEVTSSHATLTASNTFGALRGLQTFLQLVRSTMAGFAAPAVQIQDKPRFAWRGLMIDVSRHFIPLDVIKRNIDAMASVKLNVLHLHLSDDQGFRMESKKFPKLQEMGSDGRYFTQDQIRDLVAYAADRGIRVVPEFDMPGHSTSWFVGYPELASGPGPYAIQRAWGVFDPAMDPTREETYKFLDKFIGEMAALFPDQFFHIGGDEVNGKQWNASPKIQYFMKTHNLTSDQQLQQYFTTRLQKIVASHHKTMIGWDEILSPDIPKDIAIQSWRGPASLASAARQGYQGLLSSGYYLDSMASAAKYYSVDPLSGDAANLTPDQQARILGGEACVWAEFVTPENIDSRIWPRTAAIAERLWSPAETNDVPSMYARLASVSWRLEWLGIANRANYGAMLARMANTDDTSALQLLADAVEPVNLGIRQRTARAVGNLQTQQTPLNRLVDAVPPESEVANSFSNAVDALVAENFKDAELETQVRLQLTRWRDNDARIEPLLARSNLLSELMPVSQTVASLSAAGLQALDYVDKGETPLDAWKEPTLALITRAKKPEADLLIAITPSIEALVKASLGLPMQPPANHRGLRATSR